MLKKRFGLIGTRIFGPALLCTVLIGSVVTYVSSPQAEFVALSDGVMAQLIGGTDYTKGNLIQSQSGSFAPCDYPSSCPTQSFTFKPTIYSCFNCYSSDEIEHYKATVYKKIVSWCDNTVAGECPYKNSASGKRDDCTTSLGTNCGNGGG